MMLNRTELLEKYGGNLFRFEPSYDTRGVALPKRTTFRGGELLFILPAHTSDPVDTNLVLTVFDLMESQFMGSRTVRVWLNDALIYKEGEEEML